MHPLIALSARECACGPGAVGVGWRIRVGSLRGLRGAERRWMGFGGRMWSEKVLFRPIASNVSSRFVTNNTRSHLTPLSLSSPILHRHLATLPPTPPPITTKHENIYTIPNALTVSRILAAPLVGYFVLHDQHTLAFSLFAYAGITDLIDGWMARRYHLQTVVGSVMDPMADKMLMTILVGCLAAKGALPLSLAILILGRDASLAIAALYYRYASLPPPKTFTRYWDFSLPSAEVHPTAVSKANTFLQLVLVGACTAAPLIAELGWLDAGTVRGVVLGLGSVVAGTTVWSGVSYVFNPSAVKILGTDRELIRKQGFRGRMILGSCMALCAVAAGVVGVREMGKEEGGKEEEEKRTS
ncbi:hypothetical protein EJ06DRAFT_503158 [Trichodelitschia bisporula]|uniref:Uncharacterized protein n=1 Tax=Trichodelitschia bisporula TaxID=703511 RepID=A0A6G1I761_9PEZI|nr:hypothetical protein EJ06DRAFT_503158 [Trichodelitschia bisporula]